MSDNEARWVKDNGSWYYYYSNGEMATGWQKLDGYWYYLYPEGSMAHGVQVERNFLGHDGRMVTDEGWVNTEEDNSGTWYYVGSDGKLVRGWKYIDGDMYYFNYPGGSMAWSKVVDEWYLGLDGRMVRQGWVNTDENYYGTWYYVGTNEKVVKGWNRIDGDWYYFNYPEGSMTWNNTIDGFYLNNKGKMINGTGWLQDKAAGDWYYFSDGEVATGWKQDNDKWYYLDDYGRMVTGWKYIDSDWYYFHYDGSMATGWVQDDSGWYFLYNNGSMAHNYTDGGYHVNSSGKMVTGTGWKYVDSWWYYLKDDGSVATEWLYDQGNWYYLYPEGSMAQDTTVNGCYVNDNGEWVHNVDSEDDYIGDNIYSQVTNGSAVTVTCDVTGLPEDDLTVESFVKRLANGKIVRIFKNANEFFKYQLLIGMGDVDLEEGVIYVTEEQGKLADVGAGMLTTELGGEFIAIIVNGVRAYKNIKTGEIIYNESYVAGSGAGNIEKGVSKAPKELNLESKQIGKKWGKHKTDYPEMKNYNEYKDFSNDIFKNPEKIVYDKVNDEYLYIRGNDLLRVKPNGEFISTYPGVSSSRVTNAIKDGGVLWEQP